MTKTKELYIVISKSKIDVPDNQLDDLICFASAQGNTSEETDKVLRRAILSQASKDLGIEWEIPYGTQA